MYRLIIDELKIFTSFPSSDKPAIAPNNVENVVFSDWTEFK